MKRVAAPALSYFAIAFGAGFVLGTIRVLWLVPRFGARAAELACLLAVEFTAVLWLQGLTIGESIAIRDPVSGSVYVASLIVFALMPFLQGEKPA